MGTIDAVLVRFALDGTSVWSRQFGSPQIDMVAGLAVRPGTIYAAGSTTGGMYDNANAGGWDIFVTRYDGSGNRELTRQMGTAGADVVGGAMLISSISFALSGFSAGNLDGLANAGAEDLFLVKWTTSTVPVLQWTGEPGYTDDGIQPNESTGGQTYVYRVTYLDLAGIGPLAGYPKIHVRHEGAEVSGSPFIMSEVTPGVTTYAAGVLYTYSLALPAGTYTYQMEAFDIFGNRAIGFPANLNSGPVFLPPEAKNVRIIHGVFKSGEGERCTLSYELDRTCDIGVTVYDSLGAEVRTLFRGNAALGVNTIIWDGRDSGGDPVASGVYVIRIDPGGGKQKKVVVIR